MFAISLSSYSRYNANFKFEQSVLAYHDSPPYFWDQWGWPPTETSLVTHACNDWWTLDFANAFVSQGVNSRGEISTIAPGLHPERRSEPLARGISIHKHVTWYYFRVKITIDFLDQARIFWYWKKNPSLTPIIKDDARAERKQNMFSSKSDHYNCCNIAGLENTQEFENTTIKNV
jgi:hypothetical protein